MNRIDHLCETKIRARRLRPALLGSILTVLMLLTAPPDARCGYSRGSAFIIPGYGARAGGMGGALIAAGGDEGSIFWNPAYLACLDGNRVGLSYINLVPGAEARHSMLAYARSLKRIPTVANQERISSHAVGFMYSNLSLTLSDDQHYSENVFRFAYAYTPDYFISVGVATNIMVSRSDIRDFDARGSSFDAGLRLKLSERTSFGFVARNIFSRVDYHDGYDQSLHRRYAAAFSMRPIRPLRIESATEFAFGNMARSTLGGEYALFSGRFHLRGALSLLTAGERRILPHFGFGFTFDRYSLHYNAHLDENEAFEDTHRFSLSVGL